MITTTPPPAVLSVAAPTVAAVADVTSRIVGSDLTCAAAEEGAVTVTENFDAARGLGGVSHNNDEEKKIGIVQRIKVMQRSDGTHSSAIRIRMGGVRPRYVVRIALPATAALSCTSTSFHVSVWKQTKSSEAHTAVDTRWVAVYAETNHHSLSAPPPPPLSRLSTHRRSLWNIQPIQTQVQMSTVSKRRYTQSINNKSLR